LVKTAKAASWSLSADLFPLRAATAPKRRPLRRTTPPRSPREATLAELRVTAPAVAVVAAEAAGQTKANNSGYNTMQGAMVLQLQPGAAGGRLCIDGVYGCMKWEQEL